MDISSSLSGTKEFRIVKRGYDPDEVDAFLDQIALGVAELKRKVVEASDRAAAAGGASAPVPSTPSGSAAEAEASEIHRALILAQRAADEEVRKATEEGERLLGQARGEAAEMRQQAEGEIARRREEARLTLVDEINELESVRDALTNDIGVLERHVEEQREVVQAAIGELQTLLDHPDAFRIAGPTGVSSVVAPPDPGPRLETAAPTAPPVPGRGPLIDLAVEDAAPAETILPPPEANAPSPEARATPADALAAPPPAPPDPVAPSSLTEAVSPGGLPFGSASGTHPLASGHEAGADDDAFLAELRKAMLDDEPLGPRDELSPSGAPGHDDELSQAKRFGRRR